MLSHFIKPLQKASRSHQQAIASQKDSFLGTMRFEVFCYLDLLVVLGFLLKSTSFNTMECYFVAFAKSITTRDTQNNT